MQKYELFGYPFNKHTETDISFVNGEDAKCGCKVIASDGHGEYADVIFVKLCKHHKGNSKLNKNGSK